MYHEFYPSAIDSEANFRSRVDGLTRELGDRGRVKAQRSFVSEGVPPTIAALAPAPAPAPIQTPDDHPIATVQPSPELAVSTLEDTNFSREPSIHQSQQDHDATAALASISSMHGNVPVAGGSFPTMVEVFAFLREERLDAKAERAELQAKLEAKEAMLGKHLAEAHAQKDRQLEKAI
eukprot:COSAG02_NODE_22706_length_740_cov_2.460342_2_plen_177_part_01